MQTAGEPTNDVAAPRKRSLMVLEKREGRHWVLAATGNHHDAARLRVVTRKWCAEAGLPVPEWATVKSAKDWVRVAGAG